MEKNKENENQMLTKKEIANFFGFTTATLLARVRTLCSDVEFKLFTIDQWLNKNYINRLWFEALRQAL